MKYKKYHTVRRNKNKMKKKNTTLLEQFQNLIPLRLGVLDTTLCDKVCQGLAAWFSSGTSVASTNKTACHDITEILLKVVLSTITPPPPPHQKKNQK
jgi:hypothetical protein